MDGLVSTFRVRNMAKCLFSRILKFVMAERGLGI